MTVFFHFIDITVRSIPKRFWAIIVVLAVFGAGWVILRNGREMFAPTPAAAAPPPKPSLTVALGALKQEVWPASLEASGSIAAWQETIISSQIGGLLLREVRVNVGDRVKKGQVLATFDPVAPRAEVARLTAALEQALAAASQAEANRARADSLTGSGAISAQEVLRYATEADTARANANAANAALEAQREQLRYATVTAPEDGIIVARTASPGSVGGIGQELFRMIPQERLEWRGELTAAQLSKITPLLTVELTLPDGSTASARIRQTAPAVNPETRLGLIYADLMDKGSALAGMYAEGRIRLPETPALAAPAASVVLRDGHHYLYTVTPSGSNFVVKAREVTLGRRQGQDIEITQGASGSERIVVSGAGFLKDGDLVKEALPFKYKPAHPARPAA
jgi:RND family efflux transporter MFP subunit